MHLLILNRRNYEIYSKENCEKSDIKKCVKFVIDKYMWNSTQEPKTYGWLGYLENKGFFVKIVCEEQKSEKD